ncbi:MAG: radical SAM protein, partial [Candidatus Methanomethylophilaceae archaeon]|nr:radical SAM protein [Candidatus Methanomethylophilaceae archaeon]
MKQYLSVVVKPTLRCDTDCRHCYHPHEERVGGEMSLKTVDRLMELVAEEYEAAWFVWHGGAPLTLPL